jgi:TetR/AcrR family transcriptional regulator, mexJK operon transcriptional repressor
MTTPKTGRPVGRPPNPDKIEHIVATAWQLFLAQGIEGVSLELVALRSAVSKATLYKHFPNKEALFAAGIEREMKQVEAEQTVLSENTFDLEQTLRQFGLGIMGFIVSDPAVDFYNTLASELRRHKALATRFYAVGPGRTRKNLAAILNLAATRRELRITDSLEAADHLFGLWQGFSNFQLSLDVESREVRSTVTKRVDRGISVFLKAYDYRPSTRVRK